MTLDYNYNLQELPGEIHSRDVLINGKTTQEAQESIELEHMKEYIQKAQNALNKAKEATNELSETISNDEHKSKVNSELKNAMREANLALKNFDYHLKKLTEDEDLQRDKLEKQDRERKQEKLNLKLCLEEEERKSEQSQDRDYSL